LRVGCYIASFVQEMCEIIEIDGRGRVVLQETLVRVVHFSLKLR